MLSAEKDNLMRIVEITNPEFRMTLLNSSVCKNENRSSNTSIKINIVKKSSKNIVLTDLIDTEEYSVPEIVS
jgi:hypothetical protein